MEGGMADLAQRLRAEQSKVRRLEGRTATLETQMRSLRQTMLNVFQQATFELDRLGDQDPAAVPVDLPASRPADSPAAGPSVAAAAKDEVARPDTSAPLSRSACADGGRRRSSGARLLDSPELGPTGQHALPDHRTKPKDTEDDQIEADCISLYPSEDGRAARRRGRADPLSGHTMYGTPEDEGLSTRYNPSERPTEEGSVWKRKLGARNPSPVRTTGIDTKQNRSHGN
ncbi:hypothetical protein LPJ61_006418, partial [Coemansia biformis]